MADERDDIENPDEALEDRESMEDEGVGEATPGEATEEGNEAAEALAELQDRHLRLAAEFENFRKRTREELMGAGERAQASLVGSLLDVLDDFHRMHEVDTEHATASSVLEGVSMVQRKLDRVLAEAGLETIDPEGDPFDPESMEAVLRVPTEEGELDDQVAQVFQVGARFRGHLVRPARVSVWKVD